MHYVDDPETGMEMLKMCCWEDRMVPATPEAIEAAEKLEGTTYEEAKKVHPKESTDD